MVLVWKVGGCSCMVLHGSGVGVEVLHGYGVKSRRVSAWFWCGE